MIVLDGDAGTELPRPGSLPVVVCHVGDRLGGAGPDAADLVVDGAALDHLVETVTLRPIAATSLAVLLRSVDDLDVDHGLAAESALYSMLQAGTEFADWRADGRPELLPEPDATVLIERSGSDVRIVLNRPHRHNAVSRQLRDELCGALATVLLDDSVTSVTLTGRGPSFCSGGDLSEFGARPDPASAHRTRLAQSPARLLHRARGRLTAQIHGMTLGGGIEMAAFAGRVVAHPDTVIGLPEVRLGLIPGAGGTVSVTRRIGRQRCAALALAADHIDAPTALRWGLVDELRDGELAAGRS